MDTSNHHQQQEQCQLAPSRRRATTTHPTSEIKPKQKTKTIQKNDRRHPGRAGWQTTTTDPFPLSGGRGAVVVFTDDHAHGKGASLSASLRAIQVSSFSSSSVSWSVECVVSAEMMVALKMPCPLVKGTAQCSGSNAKVAVREEHHTVVKERLLHPWLLQHGGCDSKTLDLRLIHRTPCWLRLMSTCFPTRHGFACCPCDCALMSSLHDQNSTIRSHNQK